MEGGCIDKYFYIFIIQEKTMYITNRFWLKYGMETDPMEVTTKEHKTFDKAYAYAKRYARGLRFVSCTIETEDGKVLYEIFSHGADEEDYRTEEEKKLMEKEKIIKDMEENYGK